LTHLPAGVIALLSTWRASSLKSNRPAGFGIDKRHTQSVNKATHI